MYATAIQRTAGVGIAGLLLTVVTGFAGAGDSGYGVVAKWPAAGSDKWDYLTVDPARHRLFVSRATHVQVFDLESGKPVGQVADTPGVHGIVIAADLHRGFTSNGKGNSVTVFDSETLAPISVVKISGGDPDAIVYDPPSHQIYAFNGHSNNATVIDARTAREVGTVALPGRPEFAGSDGQGHVFVNLEDKALLARIDVASNAVSATWSLSPCVEPTGLALDIARHRVFSACHNQRLIVTDADSGTRVAELPIGRHVDAAAFEPATSLVFTSNGDSADVTIISAETADRYRVRGSLGTASGAKTMALDATTHRIYVPTMTPAGMQVLVAAPLSESATRESAAAR
jgi:DNA-binding beta-propeller fold protein YncE